MRFSTTNKTAVCVCSQSEFLKEKMECEVRSLRTELEGTRLALKLQTTRCRQLVAAFSSKLQEKERQLKEGREVKDHQLSRVLRALLVLEAGLRREQRVIRGQLAEKDLIIFRQNQDIANLQEQLRIAQKINCEAAESEGDSVKSEGHPETGSTSSSNKSDNESVDSKGDSPFSSEKDFQKSRRNSDCGNDFDDSNERFLRDVRSSARVNDVQGLGLCINVISNRFQKLGRLSQVLKQELARESKEDGDGLGQDPEVLGRNLYEEYQHNPVLECVSQILLRDEEEAESQHLERNQKFNKYSINRHKCSVIKEEQESIISDEDRTEIDEQETKMDEQDQKYNMYVINCVAPQKCGGELWVKDGGCPSGSQLDDSVERVGDEVVVMKPSFLDVGDKTVQMAPNDSSSSIELDKKVKDLGVVVEGVHNLSPFGEILSPKSKTKPPAIPPKPPLLSRKIIDQKNKLKGYHYSLHVHPNHSSFRMGSGGFKCASNDPIRNHSLDTKLFAKDGTIICDPLQQARSTKNKPSLVTHHHHPNSVGKGRQRQTVTNNCSWKKPMKCDPGNQDNIKNLIENVRNFHGERTDETDYCSSSTIEKKIDQLNMAILRTNSKIDSTEFPNIGLEQRSESPQEEARVISVITENNNEIMIEPMMSPKKNISLGVKNVQKPAIKIGSSVSSLITGTNGCSIVSELTGKEDVKAKEGEEKSKANENRLQSSSPKKDDVKMSEAVKRLDDLLPNQSDQQDEEDVIRSNFEEFKLEDVDIEDHVCGDGRPEGDGAEAKITSAILSTDGESYENFLEATGLSQKSILTPSRMLSNHRSVLKPKDVKHRSKLLKAAAVSEKCGTTASGGSIVKYWVEPFL